MKVQVQRMPVFVQVVLVLALSAHTLPLVRGDGHEERQAPARPGQIRQVGGPPGTSRPLPPRSPPIMNDDGDKNPPGPPPRNDDDRPMMGGGPPPKMEDDDYRKNPPCDGAPKKKPPPMGGNNWGQPPPRGWGQQPPQMGPWGWQRGPANWWPPQMGGWGKGEGFDGDFGDDWDEEDFGDLGQPGNWGFPPYGGVPQAPSPVEFYKKMMMMAKIKKMMRAAAFARDMNLLIGSMGGRFPFPPYGGGPGPYPGGPGPYPGGPGPRPGPPPPGPKPGGKPPPRPYPCPGPKPKPRPPMLPRPPVCRVQAGNMSISRPCMMPGTMCSMINQTRCPNIAISICLPRACTGMSMMETKICMLKMFGRKMMEGKRPPPQSAKGVMDAARDIIERVEKLVDDDSEEEEDDDDDDDEEDQEMMDIEIAPFLGCFAPDGKFAKFYEED